jgi:signal transduction histidine kinase
MPAEAHTLCHPSAVRQAIDNLLSNAIKHAPTRSEVRARLVRQSDRWAISVDDSGPGIPEGQRKAVIAPFHRVPGSLEGTGPGLAIVREVARWNRVCWECPIQV